MILTSEERKHIVQAIQEQILEGICLLDYGAGHQLKEAELAATFGVSRTPVRDALSRIAHLDLIETRNGVGTVVKALSDEKITDVYETRLQIAPLIGVSSTIEVTDLHLSTINSLLERATQIRSTEQVRNYVKINHETQHMISGLISNTVLRSFWQQTYYQAASVWYRIAHITEQESFPALVSELSELKTALENNDLVAVGHIQRTYIGYGYKRIKRHLFNGH